MKTAAAFFTLLLGALVVWHYLTAFEANVVSIIDPSASIKQNCSGIVAMSVLSRPGLQHGSKLTLLVMGGGIHDAEPKPLLEKPFPIRPDRVMGKDEKGFQREQESFREAVRAACESSVATDQSPILRAVKAGISHLRGQRCTAKGKCYLVMKTDLEEDVEPSLRSAIRILAKEKSADLPPELARSIDNAGIEVEFCGLSEVTTRRDGTAHANPEALSKLWLSMFTHPELVSIKPFCGGA